MRKFDIRRKGGKARMISPLATLYTTISKTKPFLHLCVCSKVEVRVDTWLLLTAGSKARVLNNLLDWYTTDEEGKKVFAKLKQIDAAIDNVLKEPQAMTEDKMAYNTGYIKERIDYLISAIVGSERKEEIENAVARHEEQKKKDENQFLPYLQRYIAGICDGTRLNQGAPYAPNSRRNWKAFGKMLEGFYNKHHFRWEDIDRAFMDSFIKYLIDSGYSASTRNKQIVFFQKIVKDAKDEGVHEQKDTESLTRNKRCRETATNKKTAVYLTEDELEALYQMPLEGHFAVSRDAFLIGCYTCQAFAEFSRISESKLFGKEKNVWRTYRQKTGTPIRVETNLPFRHNHLVEILARYDNNMESVKLYEQHINDDLKAILKDLSVSVPSLATPCETMLTKTEKLLVKSGKREVEKASNGKAIKPKYDLVSTHTARRSGITNLLLTGKYDLYKLMRIAGHREPKQTIDYIKLSGEEVSEFLEQYTELGNINY